MTQSVPQVDPKGRYELQAAAEALGIHKATLNRYEQQGLIKTTISKTNRRKIYSGEEILRLWKANM